MVHLCIKRAAKILCVLGSSFLLGSGQTLFAKESLDYDYAVKMAREGEIERSVEELEKLHRLHPQNHRLLYDLVTVLSWGGYDRKVLSYRKEIDLYKAPGYLLEAVAKSARNLKEYGYAAKVYTIGMNRFEDKIEFYIGLSMTLFDHDKRDLAKEVLLRAKKRFTDKKSRIKIAGAYEYLKEYFEALLIYEEAIKSKERCDECIVATVGVMRRLGMPGRAFELAGRYPGLFSKEDMASIRGDLAAYDLRWAKRGYYTKPSEKELFLLRALAGIERNLAVMDTGEESVPKSQVAKAAIFDKIVALGELGLNREAVALYETYEERGVEFPSYARLSIADSYLAVRRPYKARELLEELLKYEPENFDAKILLFYSYSDAYDMDSAMRFADEMDRAEPVDIWDRWHLYKKRNPRKLDSVVIRILSREYAGYMDYAQDKFEELTARAPANVWLRNTLAQVYFYRGWYERALKEYTISANLDRNDFGARAGVVLSRLHLREYEEADSGLKALGSKFRFNRRGLKEIEKQFSSVKDGGYHIESRFIDSPAAATIGTYSGSEYGLSLYSPLIENRYRVLLDTRRVYAEYDAASLTNSRTGVGVEYSDRRYRGLVKLSYNIGNIRRLSPSVEGSRFLDDHLRLDAGYSLFSSKTPIRAIDAGIKSDRLFVSAAYRDSERQEASLTLERSSFSDGNIRSSLSLYNYTKAIEGPYYNLDSYMYAGISDNTLTQRPYYSPDRSAYISLNLKNSWLLYRFYDFSIKQSVGLEGGFHWEKSFGTKMTGTLSLGQEWSMSERLGFSFGYLRKRASYDGNLEYINELYFNLWGRF